MRMTGVLNKDNKPNCLIIDEIDGAGAPAIQVILLLHCNYFVRVSRLDDIMLDMKFVLGLYL